MTRGPVGSERSEPRGRWEFSPDPRAEHRRDDRSVFQNRLLSAARAGHGLGASFVLRLETGPEPGLSLAVRSSAAHRWVARVLSAVYGASQWTSRRLPFREGLTETGSGEWAAARVAAWPHPLRLSTDGAPLTDVLALAASTLPPGNWLEVEATPLADPGPTWWEAIRPSFETPELGTGPTSPLRSPELGRSARVAPRRGPPLFWALRAIVGTDEADRSATLLRAAARAFERSSRGGSGNGLIFRARRSLRSWWAPTFPVSDEELALLLPGPECPCGAARRRARSGQPCLPLGRSRAGTVVGPEVEPDQGRHIAVLGETGMGKSSLLVSLAVRASRDAGLILFDPLGETAEAFARELAGAGSTSPIRIDPEHHPLRINALEGAGPSDADPVRSERRLNDLVHALRRVRAGRYADVSYWGPRLEEMLTRALSAAAALEHGTLSDAHTLLATGARWHRDLPTAAMGPVRELGDRIREHPQDAEGARRLLYEVVRNSVLERMLCGREPELAPRDLVTPGAVVILSGSASRVGESTARYLLSTYLALLWSELLSRRERTKSFVVLDEAQWFSHESLAEMLRLGRRANVHVVLATQAVASLPESVREAVWTNVADFVGFRGSPEEAREFARVARGLTPEAVLSLPRGRAVALLGKGEAVEWIRSARLPGSAGRSAGPEGEGPGSAPGSGATSRAASGPVHAARTSRAVGAERESEEEVLRRLRARATAPGAGPILRVPLSELRPENDTEDRAVRGAGSMLGRSGALLGTERSDRGKVWIVAVDRIPPPPLRAPDSLPSEGASPPKLS